MKLISFTISFQSFHFPFEIHPRHLSLVQLHKTAPVTHTRLTERLVKTATVIHKFTKIPCSTEQHDSSADRSNISIQTGFGTETINILAIFPASEHKDSFTALIK